MRRLSCAKLTPRLTVAVIKEVRDGSRGAAAPGFGGVDGGQDGGHEPLIAIYPESLLAEFGVVVRQTEQVTCGVEVKRGLSQVCTCANISGVTSDAAPLILIIGPDVCVCVHPYLSHGRQ